MNKDRFEPDAATLVSDDELLDALGRGDRPAGDDTLAMAFALWRDDIVSPAPLPVSQPQPAKKPRLSKKFRWSVFSGIVAVTLGGAAFAAVNALPGDMAWGVAQKVFPTQAKEHTVEATKVTLADARTAIAGQDLDLADSKVKDAEFLIREVTKLLDLQTLQALQADLDQVRGLLADARVRLGTIVPTPGGVPGLPVPTPGPSGGIPLPTPNPGATPTPSPGQTGGLLPPLPSLLPSLPLPISLPPLL